MSLFDKLSCQFPICSQKRHLQKVSLKIFYSENVRQLCHSFQNNIVVVQKNYVSKNETSTDEVRNQFFPNVNQNHVAHFFKTLWDKHQWSKMLQNRRCWITETGDLGMKYSLLGEVPKRQSSQSESVVSVNMVEKLLIIIR